MNYNKHHKCPHCVANAQEKRVQKPTHCCSHKMSGGCCAATDTVKYRGLKLWISFFSIAASFCIGLFGIHIPFYPLTDPALITVILCAIPIFKSAWSSLTEDRKITSALLVSIAMLGAFALQFAELIQPDHTNSHGHSYIFVIAEIGFLMSLGEWLEERTVKKSRRGIESLAKLLPKTAIVKIDGKETQIPSANVKKGQILSVKAGDIFPVDAKISEGKSSVDESPITGESASIEKVCGDTVYAGSKNLTGYLEVEAVKDAGNSEMSKLAKLVEEAAGRKSPISRTADRWASMVIPTAIVAAIIVLFASHFALSTSWLEAAIRAVTVLVVFCPCAFVLATPTAIAAAFGNAAKKGILIKSGAAIETLAAVCKVFFDKTGTLTEARLSVKAFEIIDEKKYNRETIASYATGAEMYSEHPVGKAIFNFAKEISEPLKATETKALDGIGVEAIIDGKTVKISKGNFDNHDKHLIENGYTVAIMSIDAETVAAFGLSDTIRASAKQAVTELYNEGLNCAMISGDNINAAEIVAEKTGIKKVYAKILPTEKLAIIAAAQSEGQKVCMVGDGINDAPALAQADSSIAIASLKNDIAIDSAQISITGSDLTAIPYAIKLSRSTLWTIKANMIFSVALNLTSVGLAFFGIINPVVGALIHNLSSVCVVLNSSRMLKFK